MDDLTLNYWNKIYQQQIIPEEPSAFSLWLIDYLDSISFEYSNLIDFGCGNGRDSFYFASKQKKVLGIDINPIAIESNIRKNKFNNISFDCLSVNDVESKINQKFDMVYSRFFLHAINKSDYINFLKTSLNILNYDGLFCAEFRTLNDPLYLNSNKIGDEIINTDHYRRFLNFENVNLDLCSLGFVRIYSSESNGWSKFNNDNPVLGRLVYKKIKS